MLSPMRQVKRALEERRRGPIVENHANRVELLKFKSERLEEQRNMYRRQRAKVHWLEKGDRNTKFFHQYATERKRRSRIKRIILEDGQVMEEEGDVLAAVTDFYHELFTSNAGSGTDDLLQCVEYFIRRVYR